MCRFLIYMVLEKYEHLFYNVFAGSCGELAAIVMTDGSDRRMEEKNIPVQMISVCETDGIIKPIRFRFEDEDNLLRTVSVKEIVSRSETNYIGIKMISFICVTQHEKQEHMIELRYAVTEHKWCLFRTIY